MSEKKQVEIPEEAFNAAVNRGRTMRKLEAAAPLIVAGELERLADKLDVDAGCYVGTASAACHDWSMQLRSRARELRGEQ